MIFEIRKETVMRTLIIPCAGRSSRFPNMKPKYLLTYPDGKLMVQKSIEGLNLSEFDRIVITIVKDHQIRYEAETVLKQAFPDREKYNILVLDQYTSCQAQTVALTLQLAGIEGEFWVKDSDNFVKAPLLQSNAIVGLNIETYEEEVNRLGAKSFLIVNEQKHVIDIIEKKIKSKYICIGVYGFSDAALFLEVFDVLNNEKQQIGEIYLSHMVSYMIGTKLSVFQYIEAEVYEDWGTLEDWKLAQKKHTSYFINLDGVLIENVGKYGSKNWDSEWVPLEENISYVKRLSEQGAQIVITTTRTQDDKGQIIELLEKNGILVHQVITDCNYAPQMIVNDFSAGNPYPSCQAISFPRDSRLEMYL